MFHVRPLFGDTDIVIGWVEGRFGVRNSAFFDRETGRAVLSAIQEEWVSSCHERQRLLVKLNTSPLHEAFEDFRKAVLGREIDCRDDIVVLPTIDRGYRVVAWGKVLNRDSVKNLNQAVRMLTDRVNRSRLTSHQAFCIFRQLVEAGVKPATVDQLVDELLYDHL